MKIDIEPVKVEHVKSSRKRWIVLRRYNYSQDWDVVFGNKSVFTEKQSAMANCDNVNANYLIIEIEIPEPLPT